RQRNHPGGRLVCLLLASFFAIAGTRVGKHLRGCDRSQRPAARKTMQRVCEDILALLPQIGWNRPRRRIASAEQSSVAWQGREWPWTSPRFLWAWRTPANSEWAPCLVQRSIVMG